MIALVARVAIASEADDDSPEPRVRPSGEITIAPLFLSNSSFDRGSDRTWLEGWARARVEADATDHVMIELGAAAVGTLGADPFDVEDDGTLVIEAANVVLRDVLTPGLSFVLGRQDFIVGDGFFLEDGVADEHGAAWNVPLRYWDGGRVDFVRGSWGASGFECGRDADRSLRW
jgi:hypothetical protein